MLIPIEIPYAISY